MKSELFNVYFSFGGAGVINVIAEEGDLEDAEEKARQRIKALMHNAYGDRGHLTRLECTAYYHDKKQVKKWIKNNQQLEE